MKYKSLKARLLGGIAAAALTGSGAFAATFDIPQGDLASALDAYQAQSGVAIVVAAGAVRNVKSAGVKGNLPADAALTRILKGTGFIATPGLSGVMEIVPEPKKTSEAVEPVTRIADAVTPAHAAAGVETVVVTSSKIKGDIQTVPIAITALSQEQLTERQIAGGPDLVKEVPNLTFSKTNFTGYNLEIRGIGTQAISVTTDPAVAVAFNDTPFLRNHFFEQEFFDVSQVEVLRGPQGTLFGRNSNAGVVNIVSAKPTDQFEAMLSADWGNYTNRRYEGMVNLPIVDDRLDLRIAGEWTKRDGYSFNQTTNQPIDGRDLWSSRASLRWRPSDKITADLIWEHFQENDDRLRSGKQLCKRDPGPSTFTSATGVVYNVPAANGQVFGLSSADYSQGCLPNSLYAKDSFEVVNGFSLPFISGGSFENLVSGTRDPYASAYQSTNLRNIQSVINPIYKAKNDTLELNTAWNATPELTVTSETGYNRDFLWSTEDYNRFDTEPGIFIYNPNAASQTMMPTGNYLCADGTYFEGGDGSQCSAGGHGNATPTGAFCDPQLGCSDRLVIQDLSEEQSWQFSQEFRATSDFKGRFNFSAGGNYLHYETNENYYVFSNTFTLIALNQGGCSGYEPGISNNLYCVLNGRAFLPPERGGGIATESPQYIDPNPLTRLDNHGHNYFLSQNPYVLNSYAVFGEAYYNITDDLKLTGGLRWTDDEKHFIVIPSQVLTKGYGYPATGEVDKSWKKYTGRAVLNWTPKLDFTDQTMVYASFAHGYKAGGQNPPGPVLISADVIGNNDGTSNNIDFPVHPLDFQPEYINAYELGTKNTLLDGSLVFDADVFYYDYKGYQISQIVDRTSINLNFDAKIHGAELQTTWTPLPGLKFAFSGGYEDTRIDNNQHAIDLMDRTAGVPGWTVLKPSVGQSSNCIIPDYLAAAFIQLYNGGGGQGSDTGYVCGAAYTGHIDPITGLKFDDETGNGTHAPVGHNNGYMDAPAGYPGFDPVSDDPNLGPAALAGINTGLGLPPNNGEGFAKNVGGNELPNAPHFTASLAADYTMPVSANWAATLHSDFYWQSQSFARVFNDRPYDKIRGYSNVNLALILNDASGWQVMGYVKNIFDTTAITGDFLNSDDTGLTTNVFLTDPRLYGVRITKNFSGDASGGLGLFSSADGGRPSLWLTVGGGYNAWVNAKTDPYDPLAASHFPNGGSAVPIWADGLSMPAQLQKDPTSGFDLDGSLSYQPENSDWVLKAGIRYGRSAHNKTAHHSQYALTRSKWVIIPGYFTQDCGYLVSHGASAAIIQACEHGNFKEFTDSSNSSSEKHAILDFEIGKNVGIGMFGPNATGTLSAGVRIAQFNSRSGLVLGADTYYNPAAKYANVFDFYSSEERSFHGIGPRLSWNATQPIWGDAGSGRVAIDWGLNLAVLFGQQSVELHHSVDYCKQKYSILSGFTICHGMGHTLGNDGDARIVEPPDDVSRSQRVTVPNAGAHIGLSMEYQDAKFSFGYRADEFFGAIDGGQYTRDRTNRGFNGPYVNLSLGLGG